MFLQEGTGGESWRLNWAATPPFQIANSFYYVCLMCISTVHVPMTHVFSRTLIFYLLHGPNREDIVDKCAREST